MRGAEMPTPGETAGACAYYKDKEAQGTDIVLRSSTGLFERTNVKRHTTNHRVRDQGPCYS